MEEGMRLQPHVVWRGGKFYYRRRIPQHLKGYFAPKKEIKFSLRTSDRAQAVRHARAKNVYYDDYFAHLERLTTHRQRVVTQVDPELIQLVCDKYRASVLIGDQNLREVPACRDILLDYMEQREQTAKTLRSAVALCDIAYTLSSHSNSSSICVVSRWIAVKTTIRSYLTFSSDASAKCTTFKSSEIKGISKKRPTLSILKIKSTIFSML